MKNKSYNNLEEKARKYWELKCGKPNTKYQNENVYITQTPNKHNQQREIKEDKPMPSYAAVLKNGKQK